MKILEVKNITKYYPGNEKPAISGLAFSMDQGQVVSFVGPSGSGKSTLMKLVNGLMAPDEGTILFQNQPLTDPEDKLIAGEEGIKMVFQDLHLMPNHTVEENIKYPLLLFNKEFQEARVNELLELCRLTEFRKRRPRELSGGQQQRLALAKTLAEEPELLLMDEPFSSMDPVVKLNLIREVSEIVRQEGLSMILVTHDTKDALMLSDKIGFIRQGELIQFGTPSELYEQPKDIGIAGFFGLINTFDSITFQSLFGESLPFQLKDDSKAIIRAEAFAEGETDFSFQGYIETSYFMGAEKLLNVKGEGYTVQALVNTKKQSGDLISLTCTPNDILSVSIS